MVYTPGMSQADLVRLSLTLGGGRATTEGSKKGSYTDSVGGKVRP